MKSLILVLFTLFSAKLFGTSLRSDNPDRDWVLLEAFIKASPVEAGEALPEDLITPFQRWSEASNRLLRDAGLRFYDKYPDDPRRWRWFYETLNRPVNYYIIYLKDAALAEKNERDRRSGEYVDRAAAKLWEGRLPAMKAAFIAASEVPDFEKFKVQAVDILHDIWPMIERGAPVHEYNFVATETRIFDLAEKYPEQSCAELDQAIRMLIKIADKRADKSNGAIGQTLVASPNSSVREAAIGGLAILRARTVPPEIKFTALDGRIVDLSKLRGQVVMVVFGGVTWCTPCQMEEPAFRSVYDKYHAQGFEILHITKEFSEKMRPAVEKHIAETGERWPTYFDGKGEANPFHRQFGVIGNPYHFILNKDGLLVEEWEGGPTNEAKVEGLVRKYLGLPALDPATVVPATEKTGG